MRIPGGLDVSEYDRTIDDIGDDGISKQYLENEAGIELIVQGTSDRENDSVNIPRNASSAQLSNGEQCFVILNFKISKTKNLFNVLNKLFYFPKSSKTYCILVRIIGRIQNSWWRY